MSLWRIAAGPLQPVVRRPTSLPKPFDRSHETRRAEDEEQANQDLGRRNKSVARLIHEPRRLQALALERIPNVDGFSEVSRGMDQDEEADSGEEHLLDVITRCRGRQMRAARRATRLEMA